jgi:hypothetical protein
MRCLDQIFFLKLEILLLLFSSDITLPMSSWSKVLIFILPGIKGIGLKLGGKT